MEFTKDQLSEALMAKLTNNGKKNLAMSERTFNEEIEERYSELEENENNEGLKLEDAVKKAFRHFERIDNNVRNDNSKFVKEWEKNHPVKTEDGGKGNGNMESGNGDDSKLDMLLKELQGIKAEREEEKRTKAISDKRSKLKEALKAKNVKNEKWIDKQLRISHVDADTDVDELAEALLGIYNESGAMTPKDITPGGAGGGSKETDDYADVIAIVKKQSHRE